MKNIGKMNLKINIFIIFISVFSLVSGQKKYPVLNIIDKDTCLIFTINQGRDLIKKDEQRKHLLEVNSIQEKEIIKRDTLINSQNKKIINFEKAIKENNDIKARKDSLITICETEKSNFKKDVRIQKNYKWVAIVSAVVIGILGIIF